MISFLKLQINPNGGVRTSEAVNACLQELHRAGGADLIRTVTGNRYNEWQQASGVQRTNSLGSNALRSEPRALGAFSTVINYVGRYLGAYGSTHSSLSNSGELGFLRSALTDFFVAANRLDYVFGSFKAQSEAVVNRIATSALCQNHSDYFCCVNAQTLLREMSAVNVARPAVANDAGSAAPVDASVDAVAVPSVPDAGVPSVDAGAPRVDVNVDASLPPADVSRVLSVVVPSFDAGVPSVDASVRDVSVADVYMAPPRDAGVPLRDAGTARPDVDLLALMELVGTRDAGRRVEIGSGNVSSNGPRVTAGGATVEMGDPTRGGSTVDFSRGRPVVTTVAARDSETVAVVNSYLSVNNRAAPARAEIEVQQILSREIERASHANRRLEGKRFSATFVLRYDASNSPVAVSVESSDFAGDAVIRSAMVSAFRGISMPVYNPRARADRPAFPVFISQRINFNF